MTKYNIVVTEEQRLTLMKIVDQAVQAAEGVALGELADLFDSVHLAPEQVLDIEALTAFTKEDAATLNRMHSTVMLMCMAANEPYDTPRESDLIRVFQTNHSAELSAATKALISTWIAEARKITG